MGIESGLIHLVGTTVANVHDLFPVSKLPHGWETMVFVGVDLQGTAKHLERQVQGICFRVAMCPCKHSASSDTSEGRIGDMLEMTKKNFRFTTYHMFRMLKTQFGLQKTWLRVMLKNRFKVHVPEASSVLLMAQYELLCRT